MECKKRILIDIEKLDESFKEIKSIKFTAEEEEIIERAKSYKEDCKYYLKKGDEISSFGCITYAHGLIDAIKLNHSIN
jgi:uncharacterized protein